MTLPLSIGRSSAPASSERTDHSRLHETAQQFEAIFLRQMLAAARSTNFDSGDDVFGGQGEETFREMRDSRFAEVASQSGAIGLAATIEAQLAQQLAAKG